MLVAAVAVVEDKTVHRLQRNGEQLDRRQNLLLQKRFHRHPESRGATSGLVDTVLLDRALKLGGCVALKPDHLLRLLFETIICNGSNAVEFYGRIICIIYIIIMGLRGIENDDCTYSGV